MWALAVTNDTYKNVLLSPKTWCFLFIWYSAGFDFFLWKENRTFHCMVYWEEQKGDIWLLGKNKKKNAFSVLRTFHTSGESMEISHRKFSTLWLRLWSRLIEGDLKICLQEFWIPFWKQEPSITHQYSFKPDNSKPHYPHKLMVHLLLYFLTHIVVFLNYSLQVNLNTKSLK